MSSVRTLPSLPYAVTELLKQMGDERVGIDSLAALIEQDPVLCAKTLRIANSSFYGLPGTVHTVSAAIALLGVQTVRNLTLTAALVGHFPAAGMRFDLMAFWNHSLSVGVSAQVLANRVGQDAALAYTSGLLHDIGRLVLVNCFADEYSAVTTLCDVSHCTSLEAERQILEVDHCVVGEALANHWNLPKVISVVARHHHAPAALRDQPLVTLVHAADAIARSLSPEGKRGSAPEVSLEVWRHLGMDAERQQQVLDEIGPKLEKARSALT